MINSTHGELANRLYTEIIGIGKDLAFAAARGSSDGVDRIKDTIAVRHRYMTKLPRLTVEERDFLDVALRNLDSLYADYCQIDWLDSGLIKRKKSRR